MKINVPSIGVPQTNIDIYSFQKRDGVWYIFNDSFRMSCTLYNVYVEYRLRDWIGEENMAYGCFVDWSRLNYFQQQEHFTKHTGEDSTAYANIVTTDPFATSAVASSPAPKKGKKKMRDFEYDYDMGETFATSMAGKKLDHLTSRLYQVTETKDLDLRKQFGLVDDDAPKNPKELVERIQAGKFTLPEKTDDRYSYDPLRGLRWRSPDLREDRDGFNAARDLLDKETDKTRDAIMILDPKDGLAALQALEAWTPTGAAH